MPIKESSVGVAGHKFQIDGVAYLNMKLITRYGSDYIIEYEPVLFTSAVNTCIFGIKTERRFKETHRNDENMTLTFVTPN